MSDFLPISSVDRREEMTRIHRTAQSNVVQSSDSQRLSPDDKTGGDDNGKKNKRYKGLPEDLDDGGVEDAPDPHSFDVTV